MINKKLEDIKPEDLQNLIVNGVSESKTIEYKSELPLNTGDAKKEFLADVSSFANTSGGDIIISTAKEIGDRLEVHDETVKYLC